MKTITQQKTKKWYWLNDIQAVAGCQICNCFTPNTSNIPGPSVSQHTALHWTKEGVNMENLNDPLLIRPSRIPRNNTKKVFRLIDLNGCIIKKTWALFPFWVIDFVSFSWCLDHINVRKRLFLQLSMLSRNGSQQAMLSFKSRYIIKIAKLWRCVLQIKTRFYVFCRENKWGAIYACNLREAAHVFKQ